VCSALINSITSTVMGMFGSVISGGGNALLNTQSGPWKRSMVFGPEGLDDGKMGFYTEIKNILPPKLQRPSVTIQTFQINTTWIYTIDNNGNITGSPLAKTLNVINVPGGDESWIDMRGWAKNGLSFEGSRICGVIYIKKAEEGFSGLDGNGVPIVITPPKNGIDEDMNDIGQAESTWCGPKGVFYDFYFILNPNKSNFLPHCLPIIEHLTMSGIGSWTRFINKEK
jgi:hypothetical protein